MANKIQLAETCIQRTRQLLEKMKEIGNWTANCDYGVKIAVLADAVIAGAKYQAELMKYQSGKAGTFIDSDALDTLMEDWHEKTHKALDQITEIGG